LVRKKGKKEDDVDNRHWVMEVTAREGININQTRVKNRFPKDQRKEK